MSVNMDFDESSPGTDYSDFEYQQTSIAMEVGAGSTSNPRVQAIYDVPILDEVGGLDNNEVAELVYLETHAIVEIEDEQADQDVATTGETRGVVGINLPESREGLPDPAATGNTNRLNATVVDVDSDQTEDALNFQGDTRVEDRFLQMYHTAFGLPFDDEANGPGGAGFMEAFHAEKDYRSLTGRGPVLDNTDEMNIGIALTVSDKTATATGTVRTHMVWDIAETSDAGRRFSVPNDD